MKNNKYEHKSSIKAKRPKTAYTICDVWLMEWANNTFEECVLSDPEAS